MNQLKISRTINWLELSLAIWLGFYLFILAIEFVVRFLTRIGKK